FKHAQLLGRGEPNMAAVRTKSGNVYLVADGLVVNWNAKRAFTKPDDLPLVTIGEQWEVPGVGTTSAVQDVLFSYKFASPGEGDVQIDTPGPFTAATRQLEKIRELHPDL
ncbi:MAG TPA: hypothetical protein VGF75_03855, partial [Candidatus Saccharimonadales bacterium]